MPVILCIGIAALLAAALTFFLLMKRKKQERPAPMTKDECRKAISQSLEELNCTPEWEDTDYGDSASYTYQAGFFRICILKNSRYASLAYTYMFETPVSNIECVRELCNLLTKQNENKKFIYSIDGEKNMVNVHIAATLASGNGFTKELLHAEMQDVFRCRSIFYDSFAKMIANAENTNLRDAEKSAAEWSRKSFLVHEHEMMGMADGMHMRENDEDRQLLCPFVQNLLANKSIAVYSLHLCAGGDDSREITDIDEIERYRLSDAIIRDGKHTHESATIIVNYTDDTLPGFPRTIILHLSYEGGGEKAMYYRVTLMQVPVSDGSMYSTNEVKSVLIAYDSDAARSNYYEFLYLWKEALEKKKNDGRLSLEEALIAYTREEDTAYMIYRGRKLFLEHRFYEAMPFLNKSYAYLGDHFQKFTREEIKIFYEICFMIGTAYCEMGDCERAMTYLAITLDAENNGIPIAEAIRYKKEYVNCLVNGGDFRAMSYVQELIGTIENTRGLGRLPHYWKDFLSFLKRRLIHILIKTERLEEAENKLNEMLSDPDNKDYALDELSLLNKTKKNIRQ